MVRHLHDIAGGAVLTSPTLGDLENPETGPYVEKYMRTMDGVPAEDRMRLFHAIRDLTADSFGGWHLVTNLQSGGGLFAQRVVARKHYDMQRAKDLGRPGSRTCSGTWMIGRPEYLRRGSPAVRRGPAVLGADPLQPVLRQPAPAEREEVSEESGRLFDTATGMASPATAMSGSGGVVVDDHAADVLAVAHVLVAVVDVARAGRCWVTSSSSLSLPSWYSRSRRGMSRRGLADPKMAPTSCFSYIASSNRFMLTLSTENGATAVCTTRPPLAAIAERRLRCTRPGRRPIVRIDLVGHRAPREVADELGGLLDVGAEWVAPNTCACSRLNSTGSTATTWRAPAIAAPCTAFMPTPPQPTTTTVSPGCTSAA